MGFIHLYAYSILIKIKFVGNNYTMNAVITWHFNVTMNKIQMILLTFRASYFKSLNISC